MFPLVPIVAFAIVFGLSMDYEVFLVARVLEARRSGLSEMDAIPEGLARTAGLITSAAAIMIVVFAAFTFGNFLVVKMIGFTLAVAVFIDATLVRIDRPRASSYCRRLELVAWGPRRRAQSTRDGKWRMMHIETRSSSNSAVAVLGGGHRSSVGGGSPPIGAETKWQIYLPKLGIDVVAIVVCKIQCVITRPPFSSRTRGAARREPALT